MKVILLLIVLTGYCLAEAGPGDQVVRKTVLRELENWPGLPWQPVSYEDNVFKGWTIADIQDELLGTEMLDSRKMLKRTKAPLHKDYPDTFDGRDTWKEKLHPIRDQGKCGSCWAFGSTEAFSDRWAIHCNEDTIFSPQWLVSCDGSDNGCQGGQITTPWEIIYEFGTVADDCFPYKSGKNGSTPECPATCADGKPLKMYFCKDRVKIMLDEWAAMKEIYENGPIEGAFLVYEDFMHYRSGVYIHVTGGYLGGHAIKILGWGNEGGLDYWLVANSWGPKWGMNGYFKIERTTCDISDVFTSCIPDCKKHQQLLYSY
eukprot:TRINITY_DN1148_c0_g4_i1.p1 TRINITY_DN1148_c0_g4~~TRINITY_DN1148_c0_g4_i1.p1  ORF type:complete len:316 (+),score=48.71 TRINITY_DN1148_c0_g4_i1:34-981(+)